MTGLHSRRLLQVTTLSAGYGAGVVLDSVSLEIGHGEVIAVLGRNGVGKSTLMLTLTGHLSAIGGSIAWQGQDITHLEPNARAELGIGWVPQEREVFPSLTVDENIRIASRPGSWTPERVYSLFPRLKERHGNLGSQLSGGEQQMLSIGRALALNPQLLLLDEPLEGLAPIVAAEVANCIKDLIADASMSVVLVEQHTTFALHTSHRAVVMERGQIVHSGTAQSLLENSALLDHLVGIGAHKTSPPARP